MITLSSSSRDRGLFSVTGRLVLDSTSGTHTVEEVVRKEVVSDLRQLNWRTGLDWRNMED